MQFCSVNPGVGPGPCITLHRNSLFHVSLPVRVFCPPRQTFIPRRRRRRRQFSCKTSETQDVRKILSVFFFFSFFFFFHLLPAISISLVFVIYLSLRLFLRRCLFPPPLLSTSFPRRASWNRHARNWRSLDVLEIPSPEEETGSNHRVGALVDSACARFFFDEVQAVSRLKWNASHRVGKEEDARRIGRGVLCK